MPVSTPVAREGETFRFRLAGHGLRVRHRGLDREAEARLQDTVELRALVGDDRIVPAQALSNVDHRSRERQSFASIQSVDVPGMFFRKPGGRSASPFGINWLRCL